MEWTATRSGKHAIAGYNGHGDAFINHPASGFRFIADEVACSPGPPASRKRQSRRLCNGGGIPGGRDGIGGNVTGDPAKCNRFLDEFDGNSEFQRKLREADEKISPCPPCFYQAYSDYRFIKQPNTYCYISILSEGVTSMPDYCPFDGFPPDPDAPTYSFTRQCCYNYR